MVEKKITLDFRFKASAEFAGLVDLNLRSQQRRAIGGSSRAGYIER